MPKISVVTTCYNAEGCIRKTIESVLKQSFSDFEYIIMDGGSKDETIRIAESYSDSFAKKEIAYHIFSEKDKGIYDGMNHGFIHSSGEYVNFLNADDIYANADVLTNVARVLSDEADIVYGDAVGLEFGEYYRHRKDISVIEEKMPFSHQSVFARREALEKFPLDISLKIAADYDFLLSAYKAGMKFVDAKLPVCIVTLDGLSSVDLYSTFIETTMIQKNHGIVRFTAEQYENKLKKYRIKQVVMNHFPKFVIAAIRKVQRITRGQNEKVDISSIR